MKKSLPFKMIQRTKIEKWRTDTFWTKEPETIEWIKSFDKNGCFFDIGANIGIYSLYAASLCPYVLIYAFEPDLKYFRRLRENIFLNSFKRIVPVNTLVGYRHFGMINTLGSIKFVSVSLDRWNETFYGKPKYIKIDVDGEENRIIKGMTRLLKKPYLKSVLVEFDLNNKKDNSKSIALFEKNGFTTDNVFNFLPNHSDIRRKEEGINVQNIIFTRKET